jgi:hypothetical protein
MEFAIYSYFLLIPYSAKITHKTSEFTLCVRKSNAYAKKSAILKLSRQFEQFPLKFTWNRVSESRDSNFIDLTLTPKYPVSVSISVWKYRHQNSLFCLLKERNANKVGFRIKNISDTSKPWYWCRCQIFWHQKMLVSGLKFDADTDTETGVGVGWKTPTLSPVIKSRKRKPGSRDWILKKEGQNPGIESRMSLSS